MNQPVVGCYYNGYKFKSKRMCAEFGVGIRGMKWELIEAMAFDPRKPLTGPIVVYGLTADTLPIWRAAEAQGVDRYYIDNSYFDCVRELYYRVSVNAIQPSVLLPAREDRLRELRIKIKPWRRNGRNILVCPQSDSFMRQVLGFQGGSSEWVAGVVEMIRRFSDRSVIVREWTNKKRAASVGLQADLEDAWALVTHSSAAANQALLAGVPVFTTGACAASPLASGELSMIEQPCYPENRLRWAAGLAGAQWTKNQMRVGIAWKELNRGLG